MTDLRKLRIAGTGGFGGLGGESQQNERMKDLEAVATCMGGKTAYLHRTLPDHTKLYQNPPQPQSVKDALEQAVDILESKISSTDKTPISDAINEIKTLIQDKFKYRVGHKG